MAVDPAYTTADRVTKLLGQLGIDLRVDDAPDPDGIMDEAIAVGTDDLDFYLSDYSQASIAASDWAQTQATYFAVRYYCLRRLNEVPESLAKEIERREKQLELIRSRKAKAPRLAKTRRPGAVTSHTVRLRDFYNQVKVDPARSTGVARGFIRPLDPNAPDCR